MNGNVSNVSRLSLGYRNNSRGTTHGQNFTTNKGQTSANWPLGRTGVLHLPHLDQFDPGCADGLIRNGRVSHKGCAQLIAISTGAGAGAAVGLATASPVGAIGRRKSPTPRGRGTASAGGVVIVVVVPTKMTPPSATTVVSGARTAALTATILNGLLDHGQWVVTGVCILGFTALTQIKVVAFSAFVTDAHNGRHSTPITGHMSVNGLAVSAEIGRLLHLDQDVIVRVDPFGLAALAQIVIRAHCALETSPHDWVDRAAIASHIGVNRGSGWLT